MPLNLPTISTAPSMTDFFGSGINNVESNVYCVPRPSQPKHMPWGELNENNCGEGGT